MKERPILFSGPMVRALLDGSKTQTRRVMKPQPITVMSSQSSAEFSIGGVDHRCPYGQPGDRLWVRETWGIAGHMEHDPGYVAYRADCQGHFTDVGDRVAKWRPSIHMPKRLSRITLEIVSVRVERLQECSEQGALAEGILSLGHGPGPALSAILAANPKLARRGFLKSVLAAGLMTALPGGGSSNDVTARAAYAHLWESINGEGSWDANPWVWVVEFKRVQA